MADSDSITLDYRLLDHLLPFHILWNRSGHIVHASAPLLRFWEVSPNSSLEILLEQPFSAPLDPAWFDELTNMVLVLTSRTSPKHKLRGELLSVENTYWLLTASPLVERINDLSAMGLRLSDFSLHTGIGDVLLAAEGANILLQESRTMQVAQAAAEAASAARSDFMAHMSHELRTPLNAIIGFTQLCLETLLDPKQYDYLSKTQQAARNLLSIVNDILDFSKIEARGLVLEKSNFELVSVIAEVESMVGAMASAKKISLDFNIAPDVPRFLVGDSLRLNQVLLNLVGNAIKFTASGSVSLSVRVLSANSEVVILEFTVRDTGIGMTPEQLLRLFKPFSQADASTTREYGGSGLGLVISKRLVEAMHGQLRVESVRGQGSTFTFHIRLGFGVEALPVSNGDEESVAAARRRIAGMHILVVEDNKFNQQVAYELLSNIGAVVGVADDGKEAIEALSRQRFDLVLMDVQMPNMDGYEATRRLRTAWSPSQLPILAMTANVLAGDTALCFAAGMNDFVHKPIQTGQFYLTIARWLPEKTTGPQALSPAASPFVQPPTEHTEPLVDLSILERSVGSNPAVINRIARKFVQNAIQTVVEMEQVRENLEALGMLGHRLKSSSATVGAMGLAEHCAALEKAGKSGDGTEAEARRTLIATLVEKIAAELEKTCR